MKDTKMKYYLAGPVVTDNCGIKDEMDAVHEKLISEFGESAVYRPGQHKVPNAWGITMEMWGQCVFTMDVLAIDDADWIILCNYGRTGATAGTAWECGYAFAKGKKILIVNMPGVIESSLMVRGCASNVTTYEELLNATHIDMANIFEERGKLLEKETLN